MQASQASFSTSSPSSLISTSSLLSMQQPLGSAPPSSSYPCPPLAHQSQPLTHKAGSSSISCSGSGAGSSLPPPPAAHRQPRLVQLPSAAATSSSDLAPLLPSTSSGGGGSSLNQILLGRLQQPPPSSLRPTAVIIQSRDATSLLHGTETAATRLTSRLGGPVAAAQSSPYQAVVKTEPVLGAGRDLATDRPLALATRSVPLLNPPPALAIKSAAAGPFMARIPANSQVKAASAAISSHSCAGQLPAMTAATAAPVKLEEYSLAEVVETRLLVTDLGPPPAAGRQQPAVYHEDINAFCEGNAIENT